MIIRLFNTSVEANSPRPFTGTTFLISFWEAMAGKQTHTTAICNNCLTVPVSYCHECDEKYCVSCSTAHGGFKLSRLHVLSYFTEDNEDVKLSEWAICPYHITNEVKFHCKQCEKDICETCVLINHAEDQCDVHEHMQTCTPRRADVSSMLVAEAVSKTGGDSKTLHHIPLVAEHKRAANLSKKPSESPGKTKHTVSRRDLFMHNVGNREEFRRSVASTGMHAVESAPKVGARVRIRAHLVPQSTVST